MTNTSFKVLAAAVGVGFCALTGCQVTSSGEADAFREALPLQSDVALGVPGSQATNVGTKNIHLATTPVGGSATTDDSGSLSDSTAQYYTFTRDITGAVDFTTAVILGGIWAIVHSDPTSIETDKAVWGPGSSNALEPTIWRFTVTKVGDAEYDYILEGQPKSGGAWLPVLNGHGYGASRPEHKMGWFQANNDNYKTLEPSEGHDEGTTKITWDLRQSPATIDVELRPEADHGSLDVNVTHLADGGGSVDIAGTTDIDAATSTQLETVHLLSQWNNTGAGRADVQLSGGELPVTVDASECWSSAFTRSFYKDNVNFEQASGDDSVCAFSAAKL